VEILRVVGPVLVGLVFVSLMSLVRDGLRRRRVNALVTAGASGTYLATGAFGPFELLLAAVVLVVAYQGFRAWRWIGAAWLLHTGLDLAHHLQGVELLPWAPGSALGCAICDPVIALWCFAGGRPLDQLLRRRRFLGSPSPEGLS
jgi:hypothetical protein